MTFAQMFLYVQFALTILKILNSCVQVIASDTYTTFHQPQIDFVYMFLGTLKLLLELISILL